jgi:NAD(P)-dependent dehydrogenase (short-subunit alcohol dehydrogenase family)
MRLAGKVALITGAGEGQGRATAILFAKEGARLALLDIRPDRLEETVDLVRKESPAAEPLMLAADVSSADEMAAAVRTAVGTFGSLHVLYNNAGVWLDGDGPVTELDPSVWRRTFEINVDGVFFGCRFAIPAMIASGGGSVINTSSPVAIRPAPVPYEAYATSKGAVLSLTPSIAMHYASHGVRANVLMPGYIESAQTRDHFADPVQRARVERAIPLGKIGAPADVSFLALYLASDESRFVTGGVFYADGGWSLGGTMVEFHSSLERPDPADQH